MRTAVRCRKQVFPGSRGVQRCSSVYSWLKMRWCWADERCRCTWVETDSDQIVLSLQFTPKGARGCLKCLPLVWNLRAVIWFPFSISCCFCCFYVVLLQFLFCFSWREEEKIFLSFPFFLQVFFLQLVSIDLMKWSAAPACPVWCDKGSMKGTSSSKVSVWWLCIICVIYIFVYGLILWTFAREGLWEEFWNVHLLVT